MVKVSLVLLTDLGLIIKRESENCSLKSTKEVIKNGKNLKETEFIII